MEQDKIAEERARDLRHEYKGSITCFDALVESLPILVANFAFRGADYTADILKDIESSHTNWRLADHYYDLRDRLAEVEHYGNMLLELIAATDATKQIRAANGEIRSEEDEEEMLVSRHTGEPVTTMREWNDYLKSLSERQANETT